MYLFSPLYICALLVSLPTCFQPHHRNCHWGLLSFILFQGSLKENVGPIEAWGAQAWLDIADDNRKLATFRG